MKTEITLLSTTQKIGNLTSIDTKERNDLRRNLTEVNYKSLPKETFFHASIIVVSPGEMQPYKEIGHREHLCTSFNEWLNKSTDIDDISLRILSILGEKYLNTKLVIIIVPSIDGLIRQFFKTHTTSYWLHEVFAIIPYDDKNVGHTAAVKSLDINQKETYLHQNNIPFTNDIKGDGFNKHLSGVFLAIRDGVVVGLCQFTFRRDIRYLLDTPYTGVDDDEYLRGNIVFIKHLSSAYWLKGQQMGSLMIHRLMEFIRHSQTKDSLAIQFVATDAVSYGTLRIMEHYKPVEYFGGREFVSHDFLEILPPEEKSAFKENLIKLFDLMHIAGVSPLANQHTKTCIDLYLIIEASLRNIDVRNREERESLYDETIKIFDFPSKVSTKSQSSSSGGVKRYTHLFFNSNDKTRFNVAYDTVLKSLDTIIGHNKKSAPSRTVEAVESSKKEIIAWISEVIRIEWIRVNNNGLYSFPDTLIKNLYAYTTTTGTEHPKNIKIAEETMTHIKDLYENYEMRFSRIQNAAIIASKYYLEKTGLNTIINMTTLNCLWHYYNAEFIDRLKRKHRQTSSDKLVTYSFIPINNDTTLQQKITALITTEISQHLKETCPPPLTNYIEDKKQEESFFMIIDK